MSLEILPQGWSRAAIRDVFTVHYGKGLTEARRAGGDVPVYGSNGIVGWHDSSIASGPCLVIGRKGAAGAVHLSDSGCWPIDTTYFVNPTDELSIRFLFYSLGSLNLESLDKSTAIPGLNRDDLYAQSILVPPFPEQQRIVAEIEKHFTRLEAGVAALKRARAALRRYRASVLKAACEGRLLPQDPADEPADRLLARILAERRARWQAEQRARGKDPAKLTYVEPQPPDTRDLPPLPPGWVWASLPQMGELARGKSKHRPRNDESLYGGSYPFIQTGDVRHAEGYITSYSQTYNEKGLAQSRLWPAGTLCITIAANIADTAILKFDACFPDSVVGFLCDGPEYCTRFVEYFFRTAKEQLERYAPATAQKNINLNTLQNLVVPLPPEAEQRRIVAEVDRRLSVVQELQAAIESNLKRAERLRQAILKRAFAGKLVPQDPDDEPAGVLLARIQAQRHGATQQPLPL